MTRVRPTEPRPRGPEGKGASRVAAGILLSRLAGFVRMRVFAHFIGVTAAADAFVIALRIPNVLQNLLGEGTLSASVIPVYAEFLEEGKEDEARRFVGAVLGVLLAAGGAVSIAGTLLAPVIIPWFVPAFTPENQALTVHLFRILLPMMAVLLISAWAVAILNSHRRFFISYVAPVLWNVAMISAIVGGALVLGRGGADLVVTLAWGALIGGLLQTGVQLPFVLRFLRGAKLSLGRGVEGMRAAIANFVPVVAARGVVNLSGLLDVWLAGLLASGAATMLSFAYAIYILPISLFGMSIAAAELPELSRQRQGETSEVARRIISALERVAYFVVPSTVAFLVLGGEIVGVIYRTGAFGADETAVTWAVLAAYGLGLLASTRSRVFTSAFFALRDARTPARVATIRVVISAVVGVSCMFYLDRLALGTVRFGATGLGLGASVGAWYEYLALRAALADRVGALRQDRRQALGVWTAAAAGGVVGGALLALLPGAEGLAFVGIPGAVVHGVATLLAFGAVYLALTHAFSVSGPLRDVVG